MIRDRIGLWMIGISAITAITIPTIVDFNASHLFNPTWPGHAKLHDAMTMLMSIGLGGAALWLIRDPARRRGGLLWLAMFLAVWGWAALILGGLIPGATYENVSEDIPVPVIFGVTIWINAAIAWAMTILGIVGGVLIHNSRDRTGSTRLA